MQRLNGWLTAALATLLITLAMTVVMGWFDGGARAKGEVAVMRQEQNNRLTNVNLVDILAEVPLREKLGHVEWNGNVLTLELIVSPGKNRPQSLFSDVGKLTGLAFREVTNIERLLVRISERGEERKTLLAAIDLRRSDAWLEDELQSMAYADPVHDEVWRQRLRLSFTRAWETRFGSVSGFSADALPTPAEAGEPEDVAN
ncbi:hypothetical protein PAT3040_06898 [Paenibacillus agaridevorans]|uniref:Uncharacterized protein n=1 Tax=Paenibacillus agaridevorans TaxID=171404 RepID=A0A2R5EZT1_9BACL|nr:hypothetical protein [Paenibacillus agaridevorans]GBG12037.1 hypothetical protein PAT3040_06898 [Paenibacillus agaridevorans]